jgi:RNA polymerase sigma factor (sigma-70 family)
MARDSSIPPESFDEILAWLNPDRDVAGAMYVQLRHDLAKIFSWNCCPDPEGLTDEAIDRVSRKVHELRKTYEGDPRLFFYGVARNLLKESPKKNRIQVSLDETDPSLNRPERVIEERITMREECLQSCLEELGSERQELILAYYAKDKQAKIDYRTELAGQLGISVQSLRVRVHRIRGSLVNCIERCLNRKTQS